MQIYVSKNGYQLAANAKIASSFLERLKGLMFISEMRDFDALLIEKCNSVHNCFVRFPIDLIFLNREFEVVKIVKNFKPWRFSRIYLKATQVLELPAGKVKDFVMVGDRLEVRHV